MAGRKKKCLLAAAALLTTAGVVLLVFFFVQGAAVYSHVKSKHRGWSGQVHHADPELGFAPIPGARGAHVFPLGPDLPMRYDEDGFRVPVEDVAYPHDPDFVILALGCSLTYGDATTARHTFPYLVGVEIGAASHNAGVCSYGLAQMSILAHRLIPELEPDVVLIQYSPWLIERACTPFAPTYFGKLPVPYFCEGDGLAMQPPVFLTSSMDYPIDSYRGTPRGFVDRWSFFLRIGLPMQLGSSVEMLRYGARRAVGEIPEPVEPGRPLADAAYEDMVRVARQHGTMVCVVKLGDGPGELEPIDFPDDAVVVEAHTALRARLPVADRATWDLHYAHWRGEPPTLVDPHPNEHAHRIIAAEIVEAIRQTQNEGP